MEKELIKTIVINYLKLLTAIKLHFMYKGQIIGLAGCFGKSSAVDLIAEVLSKEHRVFTTNVDGKGLNSESGVPFALLGVHPDKYSVINWIKYTIQATFGLFKKLDYDFLVLELGVDKPNDMKYLTSFIKPNLGILINSNNTHSGNFELLQAQTKKSFEELISYENGYVFEEAKDGIIYNLDDPEVVRQTGRFKGEKKLHFSTSNKPHITEFDQTLLGTKIQLKFGDDIINTAHTEPLLEEYQNTIEMIVKVCEFYNVKKESLIGGLKTYKLPPSRCSLFAGIKDTYILDSSYNSSYLPASSALKLINKLYTSQSEKSRRIAILGDMRELGVLAEKEHRKLALDAVSTIDIVITVGPLMKEFFNDEFVQSQKKDQQIFSFETPKEAYELISKNDFEFIKPNDIILVKGSQNTLLLEAIVERLLANPEDTKKLCRRGQLYEEQREKLFE
jgi:UDP-N-acetylmuramoyl-tripeptide--D-alanyl-D-alanine ligase